MSFTPTKRSFADKGVPKLELGHEECAERGDNFIARSAGVADGTDNERG